MLIKEKLREWLHSSSHISITTDIWSDSSRSSYLGITAHSALADFSIESHFIGLKKLEKRHNAGYVKEIVEELLAGYDLSISQINFIVTDNGSNMIAAFKEFIEGKNLIVIKL